MKLSDYIAEQRGRAKALADKANVSPSTIGRIAKGELMPSREKAEAIAAASDGAVSIPEVYGFEAAA